MRPSPAVFRFVAASVFVAAGVAAGSAWNDAHAQAWVGEKGGLDLSLDYNFATSSKVVVDAGEDFADAGTTSHQLTLGAEFTPINKLAVNVQLPLTMIKYTGSDIYQHAAGGSYDDGDFHSTLTDLRAGVRYQLLDGRVALSPHLAFSIPVADYEVVGNAVAGRGLKALHAGLGVGTILGTATYLHLLYEFSLVEKYDESPETARHSQNRSDLGFSIGRKLLDYKLDLNAGVNVRLTHGGVNFSELRMLSDSEEEHHDPILAEDIILVGVGVGYQLTSSFGVSLSGRYFVTGANTQNSSVLALGLTWSPL